MNDEKKLRIVPQATPAPPRAPPRPLGEHGMKLWQSIISEYDLTDAGGIEMLQQACSALDTAKRCAAAVARDGVMIRRKRGPAREHPLLKAELAARSLTVRTLQRLGLDIEPVRAGPGRPPMVV